MHLTFAYRDDFWRVHPRSSPITGLTLVQHQHFPVPPSGLQLFLSHPKALVSLSINIKETDFASMFPEEYFSNADLWNCIQQLKGSLECLDIYLDCRERVLEAGNTTGPDSVNANKNPARNAYAPFQLKDTLPVGLGSLTFYGDEGLYANKTLPQQLHDALSGTGFRQLVHITLEQDTGFHAYSPHEEVRRVCEVNGVGYETRDSGSCYKGGKGHPYSLRLEERRATVQNKMESIRDDITAWLSATNLGARNFLFARRPELG